MTTRTEVANYLASNLKADRQRVVTEAAAWLISTGRADQAGYLAQDVARILAGQGYVHARLTTAHELPGQIRKGIETNLKRRLGADQIEIEYVVDPSVIGGMRLELPGQTLDDTLARSLQKLARGVADDE